MDVRIGIVQIDEGARGRAARRCRPRQGPGRHREAALAERRAILWLTDRKGRRVGVPVAKVAYVEVDAPTRRSPGRLRRSLIRPLPLPARRPVADRAVGQR